MSVAGAPAGLGIAVVFDWALAAQLVTQGIAGLGGHLGQSGGAGGLVGRVAAAALLAAAGEALRRGLHWVRLPQIALCAVVTIGGIVAVGLLLSGRGSRGLVLSAIVEVTFCPFIVWRLATPHTARWFASPAHRNDARLVIGPAWVTVLLAWSAAWGVLVAWSQSL